MRYLFTILLIAVGLVVSAQDTEVYRFSLEQAIDYALDHHTDMLNAVADEQRAVAQKNEVRGIGLPQVNASFGIQDYVKLPTSLIPAQIFDPNAPEGEFIAVQFGTQYNATAALQASQLLFSGDYIVALQSSGTYINLSRQNTVKTRTDLVEAVSKAYYALLVNQEGLLLVGGSIESLKKTLDQTQAMYDNGFVEKIDLDRLKVSYNNLNTEKENLTKLIALGYAALKFQMGMELDSRLELTDTLGNDLIVGIEADTSGFSYEDRIEFRILQTQRQLANQQLKLERVGYLPNLVLTGNLSSQAQGNELFGENMKWFPIGVVGVNLGLPVFDGLQRNYRIQQRKIDLMKMENTIRTMKMGMDLQLETALVTLKNSLSRLESQRMNIELARSVFETASRKYSLGTGTSMEVVEAESELTEAQTNYYNALYEAIVAKIDYEKARGILTE